MHRNHRRILLVSAVLSVFTLCASIEAQTGISTLSGVIENFDGSVVFIRQNRSEFNHEIHIDEKGQFSFDTVPADGIYSLESVPNRVQVPLFLKNGHTLRVSFNADSIHQTITFNGTLTEENRFLAQRVDLINGALKQAGALYGLSWNAFMVSLDSLSHLLDGLKKDFTGLDSMLLAETSTGTETLVAYLRGMYVARNGIMSMKGAKSPEFFDYENFGGGRSSLRDFRGKFVFIDIWATWCKPCIKEFPSLKQVQHEYRDDNIVFMGISIDKPEDYNTWRTMVEEQQLDGVQLIAHDKDQAGFIHDYFISIIPRFILIDPEGIVVHPDAPKPSSDELRELLDEVLY